MLPAVDSNGKRISPTKGARGVCPGCKGEMLAKCGELTVHHWAHVSSKDCDSWTDHRMSPWHIAWQDCFPKECQEVWVGENNEHRADVKGQHKILEVQKSPISAEKIREREEFYGDMAWMLCGEDFENRFVLGQELNGRKKGSIDFLFTWKSMRASWLSARKPIYIHFKKGIGLVSRLFSNGTGRIKFVSMEHFAREIDPRFNPSPLQQSDKGFTPMTEDFTEACIECDDFLQKTIITGFRRDPDELWGKAIESIWDIEHACDLRIDFTRFLSTVQHDAFKRAYASLFGLLDDKRFCRYRGLRNTIMWDPSMRYGGEFFDSVMSAGEMFKLFQHKWSIERYKQEILEKLEAFKSHVEDMESALSSYYAFTSTFDDFEGEEGLGAFLYRYDYYIYPSMIASFRFKLYLKLLPALIDYIEKTLWPEFISYRLCAYEDPAFLGPPSYEEVKTLFGVMRPEYKRDLGLVVKKKWAEYQEGQRLTQIAKQLQEQKLREDRERYELYQKQISEAERQKRLAWPIEKVIDSFSDGLDGEVVGKASLAMHVAMFPDSRWADEVTEEQLEVAQQQLKQGFNPVSVWRT